MNRDELQSIVDSSNFNTLIGKVENTFFDCKGQPYQIDADAGKRELAKDVSSFANGEGGFIFIGIKTKQSAEHFGDEVEELRPFAQTLVNTARYRDVVRAWVYPEIENLNVVWKETENSKGIVVISIPSQKSAIKPFLITNTLDESGRKVEIVFGYAQRKGDISQPMSVTDLQKALHSGLHYEGQLKEQLDGMEALLRNSIQGDQTELKKKADGERIEQRISRALEHENLKSRRTISISVYPNQSTQLKSIFLTTEGSIRRYLEQPPTLRYGGWDLKTLDQARIMRGEMIRVANADRKVIDLYRDGTLVFVGLTEPTFLAWNDKDKQKINPLAVIEVIYTLFSFYKLVVDDMSESPQDFTVRVDFKNLHLAGEKSYLIPHAVTGHDYLFEMDKMDAPDDSGFVSKTFSTNDYDAAVIGAEIAKEVFLWFGIEEDKVPYIKTENNLQMIDVAAIKGI